MNQSKVLSIVLAVSGILLFSSKAVIVKLAYQYEIPAVSLLLLRMLFSLPFYLIIAAVRRPRERIRKKDYLWLILLGCIGYYLASYFDFKGLMYIKASLERLILFTYPTIVLLISRVVFGKRITRWQAIGVAVTYLGVCIIFSSELAISNMQNVITGGILIFLSAFTYGSYIAGSGWLIPKFGATVFTSYAMIISCLCVIIHFSLVSDASLLFEFPTQVYWLALVMAVFATVIPTYLISYAIKGLGASNFSVLGSLGPVSTIVLAHLFLNEILTLSQLIGAAVVVGGIVVAETRSK